MSGAETIDRMTDIIIRQAETIRELYNTVAQLNAVSTLDAAVTELQADTDKLLTELHSI